MSPCGHSFVGADPPPPGCPPSPSPCHQALQLSLETSLPWRCSGNSRAHTIPYYAHGTPSAENPPSPDTGVAGLKPDLGGKREGRAYACPCGRWQSARVSILRHHPHCLLRQGLSPTVPSRAKLPPVKCQDPPASTTLVLSFPQRRLSASTSPLTHLLSCFFVIRYQAFLDAGDVANGLTCSQERNLSIGESPSLGTAPI